MKRTIIIMAKVPRAGNVKTRLQPFLSSEECRALAEAFLFDAINKVRKVCDELVIAFAPSDEKNYFDRFETCGDLILIEQKGADLGERMASAFEFAVSADLGKAIVMIGTDSPTFPIEFAEQAFSDLETRAEIVLGKSDDGGFYLIGLKKIFSTLFDGIEWSSAKVFEQITANVEKLKISRFELISGWYDVDTFTDLRRLRDEFSDAKAARKNAPATYRWTLENAGIFERNVQLQAGK
ncbi:MAG: TIGR04282 family arsenosugar biosynthesis glycosyltransferase [Acidobacteriota bacterium]|nr:TIGR04282 family arsenosugar biosynthesis glycosyltransferase [Acidobacteriota bacterium]